MRQKVLIVCKHLPYPVVIGGIERLILGYESHIFAEYDVFLLFYHEHHPAQLLHYGQPVGGDVTRGNLLAHNFAFTLFFNYETDFADDELLRPIIEQVPSYCFLQSHPEPHVSDKLFRGIITHRSAAPHKDVLLLGGFYDEQVFFKRRLGEEFIVSVGRLHETKNQLELVSGYRARIYQRYKLPLYLVGGTMQESYFKQVKVFVDNTSIFCTINPAQPLAATNWVTPAQIAELYQRARIFVMASPDESFCVALIEALACGVTCVVNGSYSGFDQDDLRPCVYGQITGKQGSILDTLEEALEQNIRLDASAWATKFSITSAKEQVLRFIRARL